MVQIADATIDLTLQNLQQALGGLQQVQARLAAIDLETKKPILARFNESLDQLDRYAKRAMIGLSAFVGLSAREFASAEEAAVRLGVALRNSNGRISTGSDRLQDLAGELQKTTKFADDTTVSMMAMLSTFGGVNTANMERTVRVVADLSAGLGVDLASAARGVGMALTDPAAGLSLLRRYGVMFTDEQKALIETLEQTNRVAEAQEVIFKQLEAAYGGAAEAVGKTLGGQMTQTKNAFSDLSESIGGALSPALKALAADLREVAEALKTKVEANPEGAANAITTVGGFLASIIGLRAAMKYGPRAAKFLGGAGGMAASTVAGGAFLYRLLGQIQDEGAKTPPTPEGFDLMNPRSPFKAEPKPMTPEIRAMWDQRFGKYIDYYLREQVTGQGAWMAPTSQMSGWSDKYAKQGEQDAASRTRSIGIAGIQGLLGLRKALGWIGEHGIMTAGGTVPAAEERRGAIMSPADVYRSIQQSVLTSGTPEARTATATEKTAVTVGKLFDVTTKLVDKLPAALTPTWGK